MHRPSLTAVRQGEFVTSIKTRVPPQAADVDRDLTSLVHRVAGKDRAAFSTLHEMLASDVRAQVHGLLEPVVTAVAVATFAEVWLLARFHLDGERVAGWVEGIATRRTGERLDGVGVGAAIRATHDERDVLVLAGLLGPRQASALGSTEWHTSRDAPSGTLSSLAW
jgi:hypothetical protein